MTRAIGNAAILLAGAVLMIPLLLSIGILFSGAFFIVMLRGLSPRHALPADCG